MNLRAVLIDDEQKAINALKLLIDKYVPELRIVSSTTDAKEGIQIIEDYKPEIVFLDINMPEFSGFEILEKTQWKKFKLIFVTAHEEFALKAIKANAIDYLLKPVDHADLKTAVDRIKMQLLDEEKKLDGLQELTIQKLTPAENKHKVIINSRAYLDSIDPNVIISLESSSNYTTLHLKDGSHIVASKTLKEFESQLCSEGQSFMRVHVSYIINLLHVQRYLKSTEEIVMNNAQKIPLSKSRKTSFYAWLNL